MASVRGAPTKPKKADDDGVLPEQRGRRRGLDATAVASLERRMSRLVGETLTTAQPLLGDVRPAPEAGPAQGLIASPAGPHVAQLAETGEFACQTVAGAACADTAAPCAHVVALGFALAVDGRLPPDVLVTWIMRARKRTAGKIPAARARQLATLGASSAEDG